MLYAAVILVCLNSDQCTVVKTRPHTYEICEMKLREGIEAMDKNEVPLYAMGACLPVSGEPA